MSIEVSEQAHAAILIRVAARAVVEARLAWQRIRPGDAGSLRAAFRACVLAAQCSRRAAVAWEHDARESQRLTASATRMVAAADDLKARLVRAQQLQPTPPR